MWKFKNQNDKSKYKTQKCLYFRLFFAFRILIFCLPLLCHFELLFLHFAWICPDFFEDARWNRHLEMGFWGLEFSQ